MRLPFVAALMFTVAMLFAACGAGDTAASTATPNPAVTPTSAPAATSSDVLSAQSGSPQGASSTQTVTLADNGTTVRLKVGQTFLLKLGDGSWSPTIDDQAVVSRVPNITVVRGAQGVYRAHAPGTAHLSAQDGGTAFSVTIVVSAGA